MNTNTQPGRLEALRNSLETARDIEHPGLQSTRPEFREMHAMYLKGLKDGIQVAIDAIDAELRIIAAGQQAAHQ